MKKVFSIHNVFLILVVVLIGVLSLKTSEVKAAGTVTWSGPSSITIRETIHNIAGPIVAHRDYNLIEDFGDYDEETTATINYTASDTPTNYQITKSTTMNLSNITFVKPGDYEYYLDASDLIVSNGTPLPVDYSEDCPSYEVTVSVRNVVDANNVPTGSFTASLILEKGEYNEQTDDWDVSKVSPSSGVLYADFDFETNSDRFGHIELSKTVKGIGADTTKYFPFTITINNDAITSGFYSLDSTGWVYPISGLDSTVTYNGNTVTNPTTITDGTPTTIYLKHGQTAIIGQVISGGNTSDAIPIGSCFHSSGPSPKSFDNSKAITAKKMHIIPADDESWWECIGSYYTIEENPDDYTPEFSVNNGGLNNGYNIGYFGVNDGSNTVEFYNQKEMSPVTGLIFTILPYLILAGIGVGGALLVMHLKKEEKKAKA
ncbi:MAG: hypothetical protein IJH18_00555 [Bacilli bacterium]|nr:hypothetical protein [Bacilli bacterium]